MPGFSDHPEGMYEQLQEMFNLFDADGSGTISLDEMFEELRSVGLTDPQQKTRLRRHFEFMDKDSSGEVDFQEFAAATLGGSESTYTNYRDEKDSDQFGVDLYMLLSKFRRTQLLRELDVLNKKGATKESFATMEKLRVVSMFTINMGGVCRDKTPRIKAKTRNRKRNNQVPYHMRKFESDLPTVSSPRQSQSAAYTSQRPSRSYQPMKRQERNTLRVKWVVRDSNKVSFNPSGYLEKHNTVGRALPTMASQHVAAPPSGQHSDSASALDLPSIQKRRKARLRKQGSSPLTLACA